MAVHGGKRQALWTKKYEGNRNCCYFTSQVSLSHFSPPRVSQISDIRGGEQHTLALTKDGRVLSFGAATYGMLGRAGMDVARASENYPVPTAVEGLEGVQVGRGVGRHWHHGGGNGWGDTYQSTIYAAYWKLVEAYSD